MRDGMKIEAGARAVRASGFTLSRALVLALAAAAGIAGVAPSQARADGPPPKATEAPKTPRRKWQDVAQPPLRQFTAQKPERVVLANGVVLFLMEDRELPMIDMIVVLPGGSVSEPRAKAGLASITGEVMRSGGTTTKTGDELDETLESIASSVEVGFGDWQGRASLSCVKEKFDETLAILTDVLENPAFRQEKLDLSKKQAKSGIARRNDDPSGIARREYARAMYGDASPFGWTTELATIDAITRDDLVAFHKSFVGMGKGTIVGVVGDFDPKAMRAKVEAAFGKWPAAPKDAPAFAKSPLADAVSEGPAPKVYLARKSDVNQATIVMGHMAVKRTPDDPDYAAIVVLNDIFGGGGFASRLLQRVRTEMGLAYGVGARWNAPYSHQGTFSLSCQTKSASTLQAIEAMRAQLALVCTERVTDEELRVSKESIQQQLVFESDSKADVLDRAIRYESFGFPQDYLERFQAGIAKVTADDCLRVAKKYWKPEKLVTVVVGNDKEFDGPLSKIGEVVEIDVTKPAVAAKAVESASGAGSAESVAKAKAVLAKALDARGGRAALAGIKAFRVTGNAKQMTQMGPMSIDVVQTIEFPARIRTEMKTPQGAIVYGYDGAKGWAKTPMGIMDIPESQVGDLKENVEKDELVLMLALTADGAKPAWTGAEEIGGEKLDAIAAGDGITLYFDAAGALVRRSDAGPQGTKVSTWSDFRKVDGVMFPFASAMEVDGQKMVDAKFTKVEVNPTLDATFFEKPAGPAMQPGRPSGGQRGGEGN